MDQELMGKIWIGDVDFGVIRKWIVVEAKWMDGMDWGMCGVRRQHLGDEWKKRSSLEDWNKAVRQREEPREICDAKEESWKDL